MEGLFQALSQREGWPLSLSRTSLLTKNGLWGSGRQERVGSICVFSKRSPYLSSPSRCKWGSVTEKKIDCMMG